MRACLVMVAIFCWMGFAWAGGTEKTSKTNKVQASTEWVERTGTIKVTGQNRFETVEIEGEFGRNVLTGELIDELKRIQGHRVRLKGFAGEKVNGYDALRVTNYHILDTGDGQKPTVGTIEVIQNQPFLLVPDLGQPLALAGNRHMLELLMKQDGAKVWIVGRLHKGSLKLTKYGVLRPAPEKKKKKRFIPAHRPMMRFDPVSR